MQLSSLGFLPAGATIPDYADFFAPLKNSLVLSRGTGDPTFTRATSATVTDFEGIIRTVKSGEARFEGARRVENLLTYSEDFSNGIWVKIPSAISSITSDASLSPIGTLADRVNFINQDDWDLSLNQIISVPAGAKIVNSFYAKAEGEDIGKVIRVRMKRHISGTYVGSDKNITLTGSWVRYENSVTLNSSNNALITEYSSPVGGCTSALLWGVQNEIVSGQSVQTPGDYVSTNVLTSAPYHGANVDGVKYFTTQNGNTISSNVVSEATGAAIADATLKGYLAEGQRTNVVLNSATLATQNVTVSATPYTLSFYGTGSVALSGVHTGSLAGTGATNRVSLTFTPTAGTLTLTVTGSVTSAQLEEGAFASSYIPTTTASVTRNADVLSYPSNALGTAGTAYSEIRTLWTAQNDKNAHVLSIGSSRPALFFDNTDGKLSLNDGTDRTGNVFTGSASQQKIASVWGGSVSKTFIAGTASAGLGFDGDMNVGTMNVGSDSSSINQLYGTIRNVKIWKKALSDAKLTSITT